MSTSHRLAQRLDPLIGTWFQYPLRNQFWLKSQAYLFPMFLFAVSIAYLLDVWAAVQCKNHDQTEAWGSATSTRLKQATYVCDSHTYMHIFNIKLFPIAAEEKSTSSWRHRNQCCENKSLGSCWVQTLPDHTSMDLHVYTCRSSHCLLPNFTPAFILAFLPSCSSSCCSLLLDVIHLYLLEQAARNLWAGEGNWGFEGVCVRCNILEIDNGGGRKDWDPSGCGLTGGINT